MIHYSNTNNPVDFPKSENEMNERIKELAKQAGVPMEYSFVDGATVWNLHPSVEEFAELIVRDCMRMCEVSQVSLLTHGLREQSYGASNAKQHISDWFGVES